MIRVNGTEVNAEGQSISTYLADSGYDLRRVAVERNGEIVPKAQYSETVLQEGDTVEVVSFVGGG